MKEWCLEHPYLTFTLTCLMMMQVQSLLMTALSLFKKPDPVTLNIKASVPRQETSFPVSTEGDLN